jgi:hypothetical protein
VRPGGVPAHAVSASAPPPLLLAGGASPPWLSVALDRRATCRVEPLAEGVLVDSREALTRASARDVAELVARHPGSLVAHVLATLGAGSGLRVATESKLPAGSGADLDAALALATTAAAARALGREPECAAELVRLAREALRRAGRGDGAGLHTALWGGVVLTREREGSLEGERAAVDPGRVEESLLLLDVPPEGEAPADASASRAAAKGGAERTTLVADALAAGRFDEVVALLQAGQAEGAGESARRRVAAVVRAAGGAAWALEGRLVVAWAPPGERGPGRREAVEAALRAGGWKPLPLRLDLLGLEVD